MPDIAESTTTAAPETSSPAPSPASAPVTSTASTTVSTPAAERPLSPMSTQKEISNFLRQVDAPVAATPVPTIAAQPGGPTAQAAADPTKAGEPKPYSDPPKESWPTVLENARAKAADGLRAQYGITPQVTPETFQKGISFAREIDANPIQFMEQLAASIARHPVWGPQLRSSAGRTLAAPAAPQRPAADVDIVDDRGQPTGRKTYSDEQTMRLLEWERAEIKGEFQQLIQPFQQERDQRLQNEQVAAFQKEVATGSESELTRVNEILEGRKELGPKVAELMAQGVNHIDAALQVRKQFIAPTAAKAAEAAVLDTQLKKVAGNTVNGSGSSTSKAKIGPNSTQKELAAFLRESAGASA